MKLADTIHRSGPSANTAPRVRAEYRRMRRTRRILLLPRPQPELDQRGHQHDRKEDERDGCRVPDPPPAESFLVHQEHDTQRAAKRPALRHHLWFGEELEIPDHGHDGDEQKRGREHRQGDMTEPVSYTHLT